MSAWKASGRTYRDLVELLKEYSVETKDGASGDPPPSGRSS